MRDELSGKIMKQFVTLRPKIYNYLTDDDCVNKKAKDTRKCPIKSETKFEDCKKCLEKNETITKTQQGFKST